MVQQLKYIYLHKEHSLNIVSSEIHVFLYFFLYLEIILFTDFYFEVLVLAQLHVDIITVSKINNFKLCYRY